MNTLNDKVFRLHANTFAVEELLRQTLRMVSTQHNVGNINLLNQCAAVLDRTIKAVITTMRQTGAFAEYNTAELISTMPNFRATNPANIGDVFVILRSMHTDIAAKLNEIATILQSSPATSQNAISIRSLQSEHTNLASSIAQTQRLPVIV